jgi:mono/diheme cytochrome c family protein
MLQRLIFERIETRITVGILMFVGIMVLIGWVAINENARMASFDRQFNARSMERGAELYAANCATCHGVDGRGIEGRAPALNSPQLFGYDYFGDFDRQVAALESERAALEAELAELADELLAEGTSDERAEEILARRQEISARISGEEGINVLLAQALEERESLLVALEPAVDVGYPISTDLTADGDEVLIVESSRIDQVGWGSTLYDYIFTTLVHGRPTSISYWPDPMVAWAQTAGGPLRNDQIADLTNYIMNWDKGDDWTLEDALLVQQYSRVPGIGGAPVAEMAPPAGQDVDAIVARFDEIVANPVRGAAIYNNEERSGRGELLGCAGCHEGGVAAPTTVDTWDRTLTERLELAQFADYTAEQYITESIVLSGEYVVDGYAAGAMPSDFGQRMTAQDIADVVAYLQTYSEINPIPLEAPEGAGEEAPAEGEDMAAQDTMTDATGG